MADNDDGVLLERESLLEKLKHIFIGPNSGEVAREQAQAVMAGREQARKARKKEEESDGNKT